MNWRFLMNRLYQIFFWISLLETDSTLESFHLIKSIFICGDILLHPALNETPGLLMSMCFLSNLRELIIRIKKLAYYCRCILQESAIFVFYYLAVEWIWYCRGKRLWKKVIHRLQRKESSSNNFLVPYYHSSKKFFMGF